MSAKKCAKDTIRSLSPTFQYSAPLTPTTSSTDGTMLDLAKVSTDLPEVPEAKAIDLPEIDLGDVLDPDVGHRGRKRCSRTTTDNTFQLNVSTGNARLCAKIC
jgi:hypothetical protein